MFAGVLFVLAACLCWGLIFVIPKILIGFNPIEIALGRYLFYGLLSMGFLFFSKRYLLQKDLVRTWMKAAWFSFLSTLLSYTCTVCCVHYADPSVAALIFGMSPITIALSGNWYKKEFSTRNLLLPISLMALGVILVNFNAFNFSGVSVGIYSLGVIGGFIGLAAWTWFTVINFHFLQQNPKISPNDWVVMMGVMTLFMVCVTGGVYAAISPDFSKFFVLTADTQSFFIGCFLLGTVGSWLAYVFWNYGNLKLPISLAGQISIFEMLFGLMFVYIVDKRLPTVLEIGGIFAMISGVFAAFKSLRKEASSISTELTAQNETSTETEISEG